MKRNVTQTFTQDSKEDITGGRKSSFDKKYEDPMQTSPFFSKWRNYFLVVIFLGSIVYLVLYIYVPQTSSSKLKSDHPGVITVVMNTFKRTDLMLNAVKHYSSCESVGYIYIVWSEKNVPSKELRKEIDILSTSNVKIEFNINENDSLNNRFKPLKGSHTDLIFAVDDDIRVPCEELDLGHQTWRNSPRAMVGFMPRIHLRGSKGSLIYRCWWSVWWKGMYSIILTKAAFLHHDYFDIYTNKMSNEIRDYVDHNMNCEDIAMQFLISNITKSAPIYIKGHLTDLGALNGISTSKNVISAGHMDKRSQCLNDLTDLFHHMPLVTSSVVVDTASNGWTNVPSTWWEFISSDLWNFNADDVTTSTR